MKKKRVNTIYFFLLHPAHRHQTEILLCLRLQGVCATNTYTESSTNVRNEIKPTKKIKIFIRKYIKWKYVL